MTSDRDKHMASRRDFLKMTAATLICACAGAMGVSACSSWRETYDVASAEEGSYRCEQGRVILALKTAKGLTAVGAALRLNLGQSQASGERILVLRSGEDEYQAFADRCTHNGKELYFIPDEKMLRCYSGKSQFDLNGHVVAGPASRKLAAYPVHRSADELIIEVGS